VIANRSSLLYQKVSEKGFRPSHVAEVGVWHPDTSNIYQYAQDGVRTTLVEPDPESISLIKSEFSGSGNVSLHEVALCDFNGKVELYKRASSTFVSVLSTSPALVNDDCDIQQTEKFTADARLFSEIDDGTIELISIDTEGSEWFVIKNMRSRPTVISIETHGGMYVNPYLTDLLKWMRENNYVVWYKDASDSVFVLRNTIPVLFADRIDLFKANFTISRRSGRLRLRKKLKQLFRRQVVLNK